MNDAGVHYLAYNNIKERLVENANEYNKVAVELNEALKMGDLRENSEYDAAKSSMAKITRERDMLSPVLSMSVIKANDNTNIFEPGSVIQLDVYNLTNKPLDFTEEVLDNLKKQEPVFSGIVMLGGIIPILGLLEDNALSTDTPVGNYLIGKVSGAYSVRVPGGFANIVATKLKTTDITSGDLHCKCNL